MLRGLCIGLLLTSLTIGVESYEREQGCRIGDSLCIPADGLDLMQTYVQPRSQVQAHTAVCNQNRVALMVSGTAYRFVYKDMFEQIGNVSNFFGCTVDLYILLSSERNVTRQYIKTPISTPYEKDVLENKQAVASFLKKYGFNQISIEVMSEAEEERALTLLMDGVTEKGGGTAWLENMKSITTYDVNMPGNFRMLSLRNFVYTLAQAYESSNSYCYSHFMYLRDDNVFQGKPSISLDTIGPHSKASIAASKYCGFGNTCDKIFFGNRKGFDVLFGKHRDAFTTQMVDYLNVSAMRNRSKIGNPTQPEFFTGDHMERKGVKISLVDFNFSNVRYSPEKCIPFVYMQCATHPIFPSCAKLWELDHA